MSYPFRTLLKWGAWIPAIVWFKDYGLVPSIVTGRSMQPTLNPNTSAWRDIGIFDRSVFLRNGSFRKGDIVSVKSPLDPNVRLVKRIIATEGDKIETLPPYPYKYVTIPEGHIWVEGDEDFHSIDSNEFGPIPMGLVISRLLFLVWPLKRFGFPPAPRKEYEELRRQRVQIHSEFDFLPSSVTKRAATHILKPKHY